MNIIQTVARAIAKTRGDDFDRVPVNKSDWTRGQGNFQGRFRDVNEPFQCDYVEMATAAITAFLDAAGKQGWTMRPDEATGAMQEADMDEDGPSWPWPSWRAMCAASPKFEWEK